MSWRCLPARCFLLLIYEYRVDFRFYFPRRVRMRERKTIGLPVRLFRFFCCVVLIYLLVGAAPDNSPRRRNFLRTLSNSVRGFRTALICNNRNIISVLVGIEISYFRVPLIYDWRLVRTKRLFCKYLNSIEYWEENESFICLHASLLYHWQDI